MKEAIAAIALVLLVSAFALESAFFLALEVPQMGQTPVLAAGSAPAGAGSCVPTAGGKC
jgi:hypothetical protein